LVFTGETMRMIVFIAGMTVAATAIATDVTPEATCAALVRALPTLDVGKPLMVTDSPNKTWKSLFDECDASDTFDGKPLDQHNGQPMRCSTDRNRVTSLSKRDDGPILFSAKMAVDADGSEGIGHSGWPNQTVTALNFDKGSKQPYANAEMLSFIVVPGSHSGVPSFLKATAIVAGDLAVVVHGDKCSFGVVGDTGPWYRLGEGSMKAHEEIGNPQCTIPGQFPCQHLKNRWGVGIGDGVTYIVFPKSRPAPLLSETAADVARTEGVKRVAELLEKNTH
jgi:Fungal chitosanase of glycosyl hydrolase group 75